MSKPEKNEKFKNLALLERLVEPERIITFRVPWVDDNNKIQVINYLFTISKILSLTVS